MKIYLHIGLEHVGAARLQSVLSKKRAQLGDMGILYPQSPGNKNHTRLYMAVTDPEHVDPLRFNRGYGSTEKQAQLLADVADDLTREVKKRKPDTLILSAAQLGTSLARRSELERLRDLLAPLSQEISIVAHIDEPAALCLRHYAEQILEGRSTKLSQEIDLTKAPNWWQGALGLAPSIAPLRGQFLETQTPPFWLDFKALEQHWEAVFGEGSVALRTFDEALFAGRDVTDEICGCFGIDQNIGRAPAVEFGRPPSAASLTRGRQMNALMLHMLAQGKRLLPRQLWREIVSETAIDGPVTDPGSMSVVSDYFKSDIKHLCTKHNLDPSKLSAPESQEPWQEADPQFGYRASQYLLSSMWRIDQVNREAQRAAKLAKDAPTAQLSERAKEIMPPLAQRNFSQLQASRYAPHNRIGEVDEEQLAAAFTQTASRNLPKGSSGNVIVACMKNEAPYIVEWVAYHRAIGIDTFLIYTNDCTDGTDKILQRLDQMGVLHHRNNDDWRGKSPQQHALNQAMSEQVAQNADWILHIDVDEFVNVRCGNGTIQDFLTRVPEATNVAMTWRLFGHNGVTELSDNFVIDQFDTCAPKYCPKPHTVWGFKTMIKNIGAYGKLSCHRPNKLAPGHRDQVHWVNGSGKDITTDVLENGWRSSTRTIGYDLLQLNHYALRSAESFLIKRQRGRALHVDRSIGLNYWIRMDWSVHRDVTIKRNLPRLQAEYDCLMQDTKLKSLHDEGRAWHRAKADELHAMPEFRDLYEQALGIDLTATERVAYALALDMET